MEVSPTWSVACGCTIFVWLTIPTLSDDYFDGEDDYEDKGGKSGPKKADDGEFDNGKSGSDDDDETSDDEGFNP